MAQITESTTNYKQQELRRMPPRSSCFLGCFEGSSHDASPENQPLQKGESNSLKKTRNKWFSWSKLKMKSSPRRTVPIDGTANDKVHQKKGSIFLIKSSKKLHKDETPVPVTEKIIRGKPNKTRYDNVQEIILENSKSMNHLDSMKKATCNRGISTISKCTSQKNISNPTSPEDKFEFSQRKVPLSHSVSMPPTVRKKVVDISGGGSKVNRIEKTAERKGQGSRFDQFIGMSFMMVTLIIMVFWGKICAILCTSAWFYFYPLLGAKNQPKVDQESVPKSGDVQLDLNSQEYKKKVVLEGLLERNHRIH